MAEKSLGAVYPDLDGKSVLVTGGGSGIGAAIVRGFVRQKAKVGFIDIAEAPSKALVAELDGKTSSVASQKRIFATSTLCGRRSRSLPLRSAPPTFSSTTPRMTSVTRHPT